MSYPIYTQPKIQEPNIFQKAVNSLSNGIVKSGLISLVAVPAFYQKLILTPDTNSLYNGVICGTIIGMTDSITKRVANTILSPFFSKNANASAKTVGTVASLAARIAVPLFFIQKFIEPQLSKENIYKLFESSKHQAFIRNNMVMSLGLGFAICLLGSAFSSSIEKQIQAEEKLKNKTITNIVHLDSNQGFSNNYTTKDYALKILKNQIAEYSADFSRNDLIYALTNPQNGLLEHYGFLRFDLSKVADEDPLCAGFMRNVKSNTEPSIKLFTYSLRNRNAAALEDEIRDDLSKYNVPLPPRMYAA